MTEATELNGLENLPAELKPQEDRPSKEDALKVIVNNPSFRVVGYPERVDWHKAFAARPDLAGFFNWPADKAQAYRAYDAFKKKEKYHQLRNSGLSRAQIVAQNPRYKKGVKKGSTKLFCNEELPGGGSCRRFFFRTQDLGKHKRSAHGIKGVSHSGYKGPKHKSTRTDGSSRVYVKGPNKGRSYDSVWQERKHFAAPEPQQPVVQEIVALPSCPHCPNCGYNIALHNTVYQSVSKNTKS